MASEPTVKKQQFHPRRLAEKFHLTTGEARLVLAASGKDRKAAKGIAAQLRHLQQ